jgi:hypothetical protein
VEVNQALVAEVLGLVAWVVKELDPQALVVLERRDLEVLGGLVLVQVAYLAPVSLGSALTEVWGWVRKATQDPLLEHLKNVQYIFHFDLAEM